MITIKEAIDEAISEARNFLDSHNVLTNEQAEILKSSKLLLNVLKDDLNNLELYQGDEERISKIISEIDTLLYYYNLAYA
ncbi:MAG: hypothetical protein ACOX0B_03925 [Minisyncoccales bacterium]|jgi:hypothetical protein